MRKIQMVLHRVKIMKPSEIALAGGGIGTISIAIIGACLSNGGLIIASINMGFLTALSYFAFDYFKK